VGVEVEAKIKFLDNTKKQREGGKSNRSKVAQDSVGEKKEKGKNTERLTLHEKEGKKRFGTDP